MKKLIIIASVLMVASCGKNQERPDNGHDSDLEMMQAKGL